MTLETIEDLEQLKKINQALLQRVESAMDQQGNAFSLFQTAIHLEGQVKRRTEELTQALRSVEQAHDELEVAKEESDRANLSKTRFLAAASHDVLQPLNSALLSISVLSDMQDTELGRELASQIERSLETMSDLLATLLDISKLDARVIAPKLESLELSSMIEALMSDFSPIALERGLQFKYLGNANLIVRSDRTMLRRILQNVISNAIRYTSRGAVFIAVRKRQGKVRIEVIDSGDGIPEEHLDSVFEEFNRGKRPQGHQRGGNSGLGLGLSIVLRMANALEHPIDVRSKVGAGSRFSITINRGESQPGKAIRFVEPLTSTQKIGIEEHKILLIENDPDGIEAMSHLLDSWNCEVRTSSTVSDTINLLSDTGWIPDVMVADQHLDFGDLGTEAVIQARNYVGLPLLHSS